MTQIRIERAQRPTNEFLAKVGLADIPPNVDLTFFDPPVVSDFARQTIPAFLITKFDEAGRPVERDRINAHQHSGNSTDVIYGNLRNKLLSLGARPA
jgi:hypothetical protein